MSENPLGEDATERQCYHLLLALVCEILPHNAVDRAIQAGYVPQKSARGATGSFATRLQHVKLGKVNSLPDLVALVRHSMPDFEIPEFLLAAEPVRL